MNRYPPPNNYRRAPSKGDVVTVEFIDEKYRKYYYDNSTIDIEQKFVVVFKIGEKVRLQSVDDNRCILLDINKINLRLSLEDNNLGHFPQEKKEEFAD